jgi:multidrug efflux pump
VAQFVVLAKSIEEREKIRTWLIQLMDDEFPTLRTRISRLENGPPVGYPVQFRVSGEHIDEVRQLARQVADKVRDNPQVTNVHLDWAEPSKVVRMNIDQERARALGVSTADLSRFLQSSLTGSPVSQYREGNELIEILLRGTLTERQQLGLLPSLAVPRRAVPGLAAPGPLQIKPVRLLRFQTAPSPCRRCSSSRADPHRCPLAARRGKADWLRPST